MKTFLPVPQSLKRTLLAGATLFTSLCSVAQPGNTVPELVFKNPSIESGVAGNDNAVYRFPNVTTNVDALVTIVGRSSNRVRIDNIDMDNTGHQNAFQPQISYNRGDAASYTSWWMDFDIRFVVTGTNTSVAVSKFDVTALDIDGDGRSLRESVSFHNATSYVVEQNSLLTITNLVTNLLGLLIPGRQFDGPTTNFTNIDVSATSVMTTLRYDNKSWFRMRAGGSTGNRSSSVADRMYAFWFRGFEYSAPVQSTLPVKLASFTANLNNNKIDLKWATSMEKNVSHFEVERSLDGREYSSIGVVFAYGNSDETRHYSFVDNNVNTSRQGVIYYRLRSVDIDTKAEYSQVRMIHIGKQGQSTLSVITYPNPATSQVSVTVPANWQGKDIRYEIYGQNGQLVLSRQAGAASQTESFDINSLSRGYYILRVHCEGETAQQKIIKQ